MLEKPPKARIFQVDDTKAYFALLSEILEKPGHKILLTAGSVAQSLPYIPDMLLELGINIAVLDNKLPDGLGSEIATIIRETINGLSIVSYSGVEDQTWGDYNLLKTTSLSEIRETIQRAIPPKPPARRN